MKPQEFRDLITAIGPLDDTILAVVEISEDTMLVATGDAEVQIEHDASSGMIIFSVEVGLVSADREAAAHRFLLMFNALVRETGGVIAALSASGEVYLKALLSSTGLLPAQVATIVVNLVSRATALAEGLEGGFADEVRQHSSLSDESSFIRV